MRIIGPLKCYVGYEFLGRDEFINKSQLIGTGVHEAIKNKYNFVKSEIPEDLEEEALNFKNGKVVINEKTYVIEELDIDDKELSTWVWGPTDVAKETLNQIIKIIDENSQGIKLADQPKKEDYGTQMKVKLDINLEHFFNQRFVSLMKGISDSMSPSGFSRVEVQFPFLATVFLSTPDVDKISKKEFQQDEFDIVMETLKDEKGLAIWASETKEYAKNEFMIGFDVDCQKAESILSQIEKVLEKE